MEDAFPEQINSMQLAEKIHACTIPFKLVPDLWSKFPVEKIEEKCKSVESIKYFTTSGGKIVRNPEIDQKVPNNVGGIYFFYIRIPDFLKEYQNYLFYIGRAHYSKFENLRKRIQCYSREDRDRLVRVFSTWNDYIYLKCFPLDCKDDDIDEVEKDLINSLLPYCNDEIPNKKIRHAVNAF